MPKKKQQKNGFSMYMEEVYERLLSEGKSISFKDVVPIASPEWETLTPEIKAEYNSKAKMWKAQMRDSLDGKLDCTGAPMKEALMQEKEKDEKKASKKRYIKKMIMELSSLQAIAKKKFYVISFNTFCLTDNGDHLPAEFGLVEYSIQRGVFRTCHDFIHPGEIPTGYRFTCIQNSDISHKIPPYDFKLANTNYVSLYSRIKGFLRVEETDSTDFIVFCLQSDIEKTEKLLEWLRRQAGDMSSTTFRALDLAYLFYELRIAVGAPIDSQGICEDILQKTIFDYVPNICCQWHEENDNPAYCSLGIVKRMCFLMSDYLCELYDVEMIPYQHIPIREERHDVNFTTSRPIKNDSHPSRNIINASSKPCVDSHISTLVPERSKFCEPEKIFIPSAQASVSTKMPAAPEKRNFANPWNLNQGNQPSSQTAGTAAHLFHAKPSDFCLETEDFPCLGTQPQRPATVKMGGRPRGGRINTVLSGLVGGRGKPMGNLKEDNFH